MKCTQCDSVNAAGAKFCGQCGAALARACPACGAAQSPELKFCTDCGQALASSADHQPVPQTGRQAEGPPDSPDAPEPKAAADDPAARPSGPSLVDSQGKGFALGNGPFMIGRDQTCDLCLSEPQASGQHAVIKRLPDGFDITDLASRSGTKVNGEPVSNRRLADGDDIEIAGRRWTFRQPREPGRPAKPGDRPSAAPASSGGPSLVFEDATPSHPPPRQEPAAAPVTPPPPPPAPRPGSAGKRKHDPYAPAGSLPRRRSIVGNILLTMVTAGIWGMVWFYKVASGLAWLRQKDNIKPLRDLLLCPLTLGLYGVYLMYKYPQSLYQAERDQGWDTSDFSTLSVVLTLFGLGIIPWCMLQARLNRMADG